MSAKQVIEGVVNRVLNKEEGIAKVRLIICQNCVHYQIGICTKCGCIGQFAHRSPTKHCPINKW